MKKKKILIILAAVLAIAAITFTIVKTTSNKIPPPVKIDPGFSNYISGYTSGIISIQSNIRIKLAAPVKKEVKSGSPVNVNIFKFNPDIKGESVWIDNRTIEFRPNKLLPYGTLYEVEFSVDKIREVPDKYKKFNFQFQTSHQQFTIENTRLQPYSNDDLKDNKFTASIAVKDYIENTTLENIISASYKGEKQNIKWTHDNAKRVHHLEIEHIKRLEEDEKLLLKIEGSKIGIEDLEKVVEIPSIFSFKLMQMVVIQQPEQYILLSFSDPIKKSQDLRGLIRMKGEDDLRFKIDGNEVKAYTPYRFTGSNEVIVERGILNTSGYKLEKGIEQELTFEAIKPQVRLIGKGVIMPNSDGLKFSFEAVNLSAVDVKIVKIYEDNIAQFLQANRLDGRSQLKRVGRLILKKKIELMSPNVMDYGKWNAFAIDLAELIHTDPGAIYRVELSFKKSYSLYPCKNSDDEEVEEDIEEWDNSDEEEMSYWDNAQDYYYYDYYNYNWRERDNPCHVSYYRNKKISRNVLSSDLGIIAKAGTDKQLVVAVTNIKNTKALSGVEVEIYNYQQQLINKGKTDGNGLLTIGFEHKPFLLVAKQGEQRGYLKLDDGSSLSLSKFDVSGNVVQKGIKGYIYGERGVWRPGDSLFVSFILEDENNKLPENHPVVFEMYDPNGQIVKRIIKTQDLNGFYSFKTKTNDEAITGNWIAKVRVGGTVFTKILRIETVKPNRLKINIDFGTDKLTAKHDKVSGTLNVKWLHGAVARNLDAQVDVKLSKAPVQFKRFTNYTFNDPASSFDTREFTIFDDKVDSEGNASINASFDLRDNTPGMLRATFLTRVFEKGGEFSIDQFALPYAPYSYYVGLKTPKGDKRRNMLLTDEKHQVDVVTANMDGEPVARKNLEVKIYKVNWRWWWESGSDNLASYVGSRRHTPVYTTNLSTNKDGFGSFKFEIKYPEWGRYLIRISDPSGHSCGKTVYIDWPGWAGRGQRENPGGASMLMFSADKENYTVGEEAKITFPSSANGRALVSLEDGSKVLDMFWVDTREEATSFEFKLTEEMAPNIYVNITLLQPHSQTENDLPIRLYGVIPLYVEDPTTRIHPVIDMPESLRPEEEYTLKVSEENGKPMTYTLAIVDEGLLDLTRFKTPDPWSNFYAREALGVKTWDLFDMVLGAYGGQLQQVFAIGGDEELLNQGKKKADRFKPVVKFLGPFELKHNRTAKHAIRLPKYIGSVRTMVVAGNDGAYGFAEKATPVKNPLMLLATLPRVVGPREKVKLPVTLFAMDEKFKSAKVWVESNDYFTISGEEKKEVTITETGEYDLSFDLKVSNNLGIGKVKIMAKAGNEKADYEIEIDVRAANPPITETEMTALSPGESWNMESDIFGIAGTNSATLEVSNIPPIDFGRRLKYLLQYPHGCIEQTTSAAFPQLYLSAVIETDSKMKDKIEQNVEAGLERLLSFQLSNGAFSYWPGNADVSSWGTSYAGHFMLEAEKKGYALPIGIKDSWIDYQRRSARNWSYNGYKWSLLAQAYKLYTLALAGEAEIGSMNRLREMPNLTTQAKWRLAAAYALAGKKDVAKKMVDQLSWKLEDYKELSYTYGSTTRDYAMILETYTILGMKNEAVPLMETISAELSSSRWMSTQSTAYALMAMAKFAGETELTDSKLSFEYKFAGEEDRVATDKSIEQFSKAINQKKTISSTVKNTGESMIYVNLAVQGTPVENTLAGEENNLRMRILYEDMDGNTVDVSSLKQGTDFKAIVTLSNPGIRGHYKELALTQIFPSGWEIHNTRMYEVGSGHEIDQPQYRDIRDDRVYTYFELRKGKSKTFVVLLNAAYAGEFYLPSIMCEAMYDNRINARTEGRWVKVVKTN